MAAELNIQIGAEVNGAIRGLQQVENQAQRTFQKVASNSVQAGTAVNNLSRIVQDAPFGFIAISNNLQPLFDDFTKLKGQTGSIGGAFKALAGSIAGPAGIGLAFAAATSLITVFSKELFGSGKAAEKAKSDTDKLKDSIAGVFSETAKEAASTAALVSVLRNENETRDRKLSAIKQLQSIQPEIFNGLKLEGDTVIGLDSAYQNYISNLQTVISAKIKQVQLEQAIEKLLKLQGTTLTADEKRYRDFGNSIGKAYQKQIEGSAAGAKFSERARKQTEKETNQIKLLQDEIKNLTKDLGELSKGVKLPDLPDPKVKNINFDELNAIQIGLAPFEKAIAALLDKKAFDLKALRVKISGVIIEEPKKFADRLQSETTNVIENTFKKTFKPKEAVKLDPAAIEYGKQFVKTLDSINEAINNVQIEGLTAIGEAIGTAFAGGDVRNIFQSFISSIASGITAIGKQLIILGITAKATKEALKTLFSNPVAMIAAGVGLVAVGSAIRGVLSKGIEGREKGGPVSGNTPYIVGERGPELFVPSVGGSIIPNNKLGAFSGRPAFAMSGNGRSIVRGSDIILSYARTQRSQSRVNG